MDLMLSLAGVLGALLLGAASPGPSFVLVARLSVATSRVDGLFAALGMGVGGMVFAALALLGLQALLASVPWLYFALKLGGGLYLVHMAVRIWRGAKAPLPVHGVAGVTRQSKAKSFWLGVATQLSNPKTAVVYGSIFAALLPKHLPLAAAVALPCLVFVVEAGWYAVVAWVLSAPSPRAAYLRSKTHIDRVAGAVLGALGLKLVAAANHPGP